jgi:hypothetical protein
MDFAKSPCTGISAIFVPEDSLSRSAAVWTLALLAVVACSAACRDGGSIAAPTRRVPTNSGPPLTFVGPLKLLIPEPHFDAAENTLLWFDDFSNDSTPLAAYVTLSDQFIHHETTAGIDGSGALRMDWVPRDGCADDSRLIEAAFPASVEVYAQFSVRYSPGFVFDWIGRGGPCTGNAKKLFFLWSHEGSRFDLISENHVLGVGSDNDHPLFAQNTGSPRTVEAITDGKWHRFTVHVRQSSTPTAPDGFIYGWIDGIQVWSVEHVATNNSGGYYDFKIPTTFNSGSPVAQSEWLDNLRVWR